MFFKGSRYADVGDDQIVDKQGRVVRFKKVRFIPETPGLVAHTVQQGQRLDHIADLYYKDPELFWRIADANFAMDPDELTAEPGRAIRIPGAD